MMDQLAVTLSAIAFPAIDPVIFSIGPLQLRWYSLAYIVGIILGWQYAKRLVTNDTLWPANKKRPSVADLDDFLFWAVIGIVLGGRLGYVLFYNLPFYVQNPGEILAVWEGGMSFHGGFLGVSLAMILFARSRGLPLWTLVDVVAAVVPIGIFFGRLANFINSELWGSVTTAPWGVIFPNGGPLARHPTQLYEALLEGIVLVLILRVITHARLGFHSMRLVSGVFVGGYGLARTFVEFYRQPDAQIGYLFGTSWLTMGIMLSVPMIIAGLILIGSAKRHTIAAQ